MQTYAQIYRQAMTLAAVLGSGGDPRANKETKEKLGVATLLGFSYSPDEIHEICSLAVEGAKEKQAQAQKELER